MNTDYINFSYNNNFLHNHNIFNNNNNIGIGTSTPKHTIDIHGNLSSSNNINISGSLVLDKTYLNELTFLEYNINTTQIQPLKFINQSNNITNNRYDWIIENNNLKLDFHNKNDNTLIPFQSIPYRIIENITLYSKYSVTLTHVFLYESLNNNTIQQTSVQDLEINSNNYTLTKISDYYYKLNNSITLNKNEQNLITINSSGSSGSSGSSNLNLNITTQVNVIQNQYTFDNIVINNNNFNLSLDTTYNLVNIPYEYPLVILDNTNITINEEYSSFNNTENLSININSNEENYNGNYNFYFNDISFSFDSIFHDDISLLSSYNSFDHLGGTNVFRFKKQDYVDLDVSISDITSNSVSVSVSNVNSANYYVLEFNSSSYTLDNTLQFYVTKNKQYTFTNIPQSHPLAFIDSDGFNSSDIHVMYYENFSSVSTSISNPLNNDIIDVYVSSGSFSNPFYNFTDINGNSILNTDSYGYNLLNINKKYRFYRYDNSNEHPFYISTNGYEEGSNSNITLTGDGNATTGITNSQNFTLEFNINNISTMDTLHYYCTNHDSMIYQFKLTDTTTTTTSTNIKYYYGTISFLVLDSFTNSISLKCQHHGYMGGTNVLIYKPETPEIPDNNIIEILNNGDVNTINVTTDASYYLFNGVSLNTINKYYVNTNNYYTLLNIPANYELGFLNNNNIEVYSDDLPSTLNVNGVQYNFYKNNITFKITNSYADDISIYCKTTQYMGGKYLLRSKDFDNTITDLPLSEITLGYNSTTNKYTYTINSTTTDIKKYFVNITDTYLFKAIPSDKSLTILSNNITFTKYTYQLINNGVTYNAYYGDLQFTVNNTSSNISIDSSNSSIISANNVLIFNDNINFKHIILLGTYNFNGGLLWNINTNDNLLFINNNIGIGTTNIFNTQLYINDSANLINTHVYNKIDTHSSSINTINNNGKSYINGIISNDLHINKTNQNVGIGTNNTNDFLNIGNNLIVNHNNNATMNNLSFINNINFNNNINILYKNKPFVIFNNNNNEFTYKLNNIYKSSNKLYILNNLNLNNTVSNKVSNTNDLDNTNNILNVHGNLNITENINIENTLIIKNLDNITFDKSINVINFKNKNYLLNNGFTYSKYLESENVKTNYLKIPYKSTTNQEGDFYYDNNKNKFIGNNGKNIEFLSNYEIANTKSSFDYVFNGLTELLYTHNKHINTNNINVSKQFVLPKINFYHDYFSQTINKSLLGNMRFNTNTLYPQIYNGKEWCSIKYSNTDTQINYISFDNINDLEPAFHNRRFNYKNTSLSKPTFFTLSINPYISINVIFKSDDIIVKENTINNTSSSHISQNFDIQTNIIEDFNKIEFLSRKYNSDNTINLTNTLNYTCSFSFISNQLENFISKYEFFKIEILPDSTNIFKLSSSFIPTNLVYNNIFRTNLNNIQFISGQQVVDDDVITREDIQDIIYYRDTKKLQRNYYNKLYELNYNLNGLKKLSLNFIENLINNKVGLFEDDLKNSFYDDSNNTLFINQYNMQYNIVYDNSLFIKAFSNVILSSPIINSNNTIQYRITDPSRTAKYEYQQLYESDLLNTNYNNTFYDINYNENDDTFYMENTANSHKFNIFGNGDYVVLGLEFITCQLKQTIS